MKESTSQSSEKQIKPLSFVSVVRYCFAVLLGLAFVVEQASVIAHEHGERASLDSNIALVSNHKSSWFSQPIEAPSDNSDQESDDQDAPDDKRESSEDCDDEVDKLLAGCYDINTNGIGLESTLAQIKLGIERRSTISLFILHHSWKSFLF